MKKLYILLLAVMATLSLKAATLEEAKKLYTQGYYAEAIPVLLELYKANPRNVNVNQWLGVSLYKTGNKNESRKYLEYVSTKNGAESKLYLSYMAFDDYDFEKAHSYAESYIESLRRAKKAIPSEAEEYMEKTRSALSMIDHVEKIVIIDSLVVDSEEFFNAYKLAPEVGKFISTDSLPYEKPQPASAVFMPENGDRMMWAAPDSTGVSKIMETSRLIDGSWEHYTVGDEILNVEGDIAYPFMMPDGSTLYYSSDGNGSIGGYDIYMTRKNNEDGTFFQPQNVGMPYNSPFDDYLLVIDEVTGIGWWATDRNQIPGKITIYVFIPKEIRENYDSEDENLQSFAAVKSIKETWQTGEDYSEYFERIARIGSGETKKKKDFELYLCKGMVYTTIDDAKTTQGKNCLEKYIAEKKNFEKNKVELKELRSSYHDSAKSERNKLKSKILQLEKKLQKETEELEYLKNSIIKSEKKNK